MMELTRNKKLEILKQILRNSIRRGDCLIHLVGLSNQNEPRMSISYGNHVYVTYTVGRVVMHLLQDFPLDSELWVLHKDDLCNSRACIEPNHLKIGTARENSRDALKKYGINNWHKNKDYSVCKRGHPRTARNLYADGRCGVCRREKYANQIGVK